MSSDIDVGLEQQLLEIHNGLKQIQESIEILKYKADAILRQTFQLAEFTVPRLFIVLPESMSRFDPAQWVQFNYRLYFLCECDDDNGPHLAFHEGYEIKQPREFLRKYGPYLRKMLTVMKYTIRASTFILPPLKHIVPTIPNSIIPEVQRYGDKLSKQIEQFSEILTKVEQSENISLERKFQYTEGVELRGIEGFLKKYDAHHSLGNLYRSVTNDGHIRWVCIQHYEQCYSENIIKGLREDFQNLGGSITRDTALIGEQASSNFTRILSIFRKGLRVYSIVLKDVNLEEKDFHELLTFVSQQSVIQSLQLENIIVLSKPFDMKKRMIISKLNETVRANDKLQIEYSFTKSLNKFQSKVISNITKTNTRLIFRLRSREKTPSLELIGTKENGFILSINNSDEKYDVNYRTAIRNIFLFVPNINEIILRKGVISNQIWSEFFQFLTTNGNPQKLTIDCCLTLEQTKELSISLTDNKKMLTLHMCNAWEKDNEIIGLENIFHTLQMNTVLVEFDLTSQTDILQFDFIAKCLLENKSLRVLQLPRSQIQQNTDLEICEHFLRNTSLHTLSLELISINCQASFERLACAVDKNQTLEILQLKGSDCSAIFHRQNHISHIENNLVRQSLTQTSTHTSRTKSKRFLELLSCFTSEHRHHPHEEIILSSMIFTERENRKQIPVEPFYTLCDHPSFYKQIQEMTQNYKLKKLQIAVRDDLEMSDMSLCLKSNSTVTELRFSKRILTVEDIQMLVQALRDNSTVTHLSLNEIIISIIYFRQIFDVLCDDRTLRVLEVQHCIPHSDRDLFLEEVKALEMKNPSLKIVYESP